MIRCTHDVGFVIEVLGDGLATVHARDKRWPGQMESRPLYISKEWMVFYVFCVIKEHYVPGAIVVAETACTECSVAKYPIVFSILLRGQSLATLF